MKAKYLVLFFGLFSSAALAQNLTLPELFNLCSKPNWVEVNETIISKGWEYNASSKGDDTHYNTITWSYNKQAYSEKAQAWLYLYTYEDFPAKLSYSCFNKKSYSTVKSGIATAGLRLVNNSIGDNEITTTYANTKFIVTIETGKHEKEEDSYEENSIIAYTITVIKKSSVFDNDNGLKKLYDDAGNLASEYTLRDGKIEGVAKGYYPNGQVRVIANFVKGTKQGPSKEFDEEGNLVAEVSYLNGELSGPFKIYKSGKLTKTGNSLMGKKNGLFKVFNVDGKVVSEYNMKDDSLDGPSTSYYYEDNKLFFKTVGQYVNGARNGLWQSIEFNNQTSDIFSYHTYINDEYNGDFKEVHRDSIIFGTYRNGLLNGQYKIYTSLQNLLNDEVSGDTSGSILRTVGNYLNGQKSGNWKYYSLSNVLIAEGQYYNDEMTGEWKYYFDLIKKEGESNKFEPYSKQLYLVENYQKGKLNGKIVQYANIVKVVIPCDNSISNNNSLDTCFAMKYEKLYEIGYYKDNVLNGPCEIKDSVGNVILQGAFDNGQKNGPWLEKYDQVKSDSSHYYLCQRGNYFDGKRTGIWDEYLNDSLVNIKYSYKNGMLDGTTVEFNGQNKPRTERLFENGKLTEVKCYDSLGSSVQEKFEILSESPNDLKCRLTRYDKNGSTSQVYWMKKDEQELNYNSFEFELIVKISDKLSDGSSGYADGEFKSFDANNQLLVEGSSFKNSKIGLWKYYYRDIGIVINQEYTNNTPGVEKFFTISRGQPYSGRFIQRYGNGQLHYEFKISNGLRDGKSKYYDESGKLVKTEKYDKGIID